MPFGENFVSKVMNAIFGKMCGKVRFLVLDFGMSFFKGKKEKHGQISEGIFKTMQRVGREKKSKCERLGVFRSFRVKGIRFSKSLLENCEFWFGESFRFLLEESVHPYFTRKKPVVEFRFE